jgi:hypothetical protein
VVLAEIERIAQQRKEIEAQWKEDEEAADAYYVETITEIDRLTTELTYKANIVIEHEAIPDASADQFRSAVTVLGDIVTELAAMLPPEN